MAEGADFADPAPVIDELARWKRRRRWLASGIAVGTLALLGFIYGVACWRGETLRRSEIQRIAARNEPVWFADLAPPASDPAIARGRRVAAILKAFDRLPHELLEQAIIAPASHDVQAQVQSLIDSHRAELQTVLAQLRQGECRLEYNFQNPVPYNTLLPTVQNSRSAARLLAAEFQFRVARGEHPGAVQAMLEALELGEVLRHEPFAVSLYVRASVDRYALDDLQVALGQRLLDQPTHEIVDARLVDMESRFRAAPVLRAERAAMLTMMENLGHADVSGNLEDVQRGISRAKAEVLNHWWGSWIYRPRRLHQEAIALGTISRMADLIDVPGPEAAERFAEADALMRDGDLPLCEEFSSHLHQLREVAMNHRQWLVSARLALAVCGFRDRHGRLPDSLSDLGVSPLADTAGLTTGQPIQYLKTSDGFVIYDGAPKQGRFEVRFAP